MAPHTSIPDMWAAGCWEPSERMVGRILEAVVAGGGGGVNSCTGCWMKAEGAEYEWRDGLEWRMTERP